MHRPQSKTLLRLSLLLAVAAGSLAGACAGLRGPGRAGSFASVRPVLERHCVHCHGAGRLPHMIAFNDTSLLEALKGPGKWIQPGKPEDSRFYQVVAASDEQPGAMPPTGHAISRTDVSVIRAWIEAGAPLPPGEPVTLEPRGELSRSH